MLNNRPSSALLCESVCVVLAVAIVINANAINRHDGTDLPMAGVSNNLQALEAVTGIFGFTDLAGPKPHPL